MSKINTEYLGKCVATVKKSYEMLRQTNEGTIEYVEPCIRQIHISLEGCSSLQSRLCMSVPLCILLLYSSIINFFEAFMIYLIIEL